MVTDLSRISINMTDWTATTRSLRLPEKPPIEIEMPSINYAYNSKKYKYGYAIRNCLLKDQNAIWKVNIFVCNAHRRIHCPM